MYCLAGRRRERPEAHARPPPRPWRPERCMGFVQMKHFCTHILLTHAGEHTDQRVPPSLPCRLRSFDRHWRCNSPHHWGFTGVVDLK